MMDDLCPSRPCMDNARRLEPRSHFTVNKTTNLMSRLDNTFPYSIQNDLSCVVQSQLLHQVGPMAFDSIGAYIEYRRRFLVRFPFRYELQNLALSFRQKIVRILDMVFAHQPDVIFQQCLRNRRRKKWPAGDNRADGAFHVFICFVLEQVAAGSGIQSPYHVAFIRVHAKDDNRGTRILVKDLTDRLQAIEQRHADVHDYDVRLKLVGETYRLPAIGGFSDYLHVCNAVK